jgi:hypothetical protein
MELEIATVDDMIQELRERNLFFVLIAVEHFDESREPRAWVCGQGRSHKDVKGLLKLGQQHLQEPPEEHADADEDVSF